MPARSAFMHVRWAIMFRPYSSCAIFATSIVREELPDPPAEYVTETNEGESGAKPPITSRASSTGRSPFGGKISNETGSFSPPKTSMMCMRTPLRKTAHRFASTHRFCLAAWRFIPYGLPRIASWVRHPKRKHRHWALDAKSTQAKRAACFRNRAKSRGR